MSGVLDIDAQARRGGFALRARAQAPLDGITGVFGPSGAGKSLLLSAIAGLTKLDAGHVLLDGVHLEQVAPHARGIGLVFQDARLFPHLSVRGNLEFAQTRAPEGAHLSVEAAADALEIAPLLERAVRNLSGGERGRVALARALLSRPRLLLLDEPFAALDGARRMAFLALLRRLHEETGAPMVFVSHQIEDVAAIADHVWGVREGEVIAQGPLAQCSAEAAFQDLLGAQDIGVAVQASHFVGAGAEARRFVWVRADAVLLAVEEPRGLSARNIWPGEIAEMRGDGAALLARVQTAFGPVLARVTREAAAELELRTGRTVWAVVKAHAV